MKKKFEDMNRLEQSILVVLYKCYPESMSQLEITKAIAGEGLLKMSKEEFKLYHANLVALRKHEGIL